MIVIEKNGDRLADVKEVQAAVRAAMDRKAEPLAATPPHFGLAYLKTCPPKVLDLALGDLSVKFQNFLGSADLEHPDVAQLLGPEVVGPISEAARLAEYAVNNNMDSVLAQLKMMVPSLPRERLTGVDDPLKVGRLCRVAKSKAHREAARELRGVRKVELGSWLRTNITTWGGYPASFKGYTRFGDGRIGEIAKAEVRVNRYKKLGCLSMAAEIEKTVAACRARISDDLLGFQRVSMTDVALILAKLHGFRLADGGYDPTHRILATNPAPGFSMDKHKEFWEPVKDSTHRPPLKIEGEQEYAPRAYPWAEFKSLASSGLSKIIERMDELPEAHGKPIFDHFMVIVPGFNVQMHYAPPPSARQAFDYNSYGSFFNTTTASSSAYGVVPSDPWGNNLKQQLAELSKKPEKPGSVQESIKAVDLALTKSGHLTPVVLGDRDGKCYFLSYFE